MMARSALKSDPILLPKKALFNQIEQDDAEAWIYEDGYGLDVIIQTNRGTVMQQIPWKIIEGCITRYRRDKANKQRGRKNKTVAS